MCEDQGLDGESKPKQAELCNPGTTDDNDNEIFICAKLLIQN